MFGLSELLSLIISAFIILPLVLFLRESGYIITSFIFGVKNPRLTIGSGPRLFKIGIFDLRKHYHLYSWFSYDSLKRKSKTVYVLLYASPILVNLFVALTINALIANGLLDDYKTFWERFIFYSFYYILFDSIPMTTTNEKPNNGMIIYNIIRYGKRTDANHEPFIPATSEMEEQSLKVKKDFDESKEVKKKFKKKLKKHLGDE